MIYTYIFKRICNLHMLSVKEQSFIDVAVQEAKQSTCLRMHGCVLVSGGKIISKGFNHHGTSICDYSCTCHAEMCALKKAYNINMHTNLRHTNKLKKSSLYVVRIDLKQNILKNSAPCYHCTRIIKLLNVTNIIYSSDDNKFVKIKTCDYETNYETMGNRNN